LESLQRDRLIGSAGLASSGENLERVSESVTGFLKIRHAKHTWDCGICDNKMGDASR